MENIGFAARAMQNMGFTSLKIVTPSSFDIQKLKLLAVHADDIIDSMQVYTSLQDAINTDEFTIGFSARKRKIARKHRFFRAALDDITAVVRNQKTAVIFGNEETGLTNAELESCQLIIQIPTPGPLTSINLAQSVMIVLYELAMEFMQGYTAQLPSRRAPVKQLQRLFAVIDSTIGQNMCINKRGHTGWNEMFKRIFAKTALTPEDVNALLGFFNKFADKI